MLRFFLPLLALAATALGIDDYQLGPDSQVQPGVPQGTVTQHKFENSQVYPGTTRDYWVYVPAQYDAAKPACLMVFCDGGGFAKRDGGFRTPVVFDNLIARKEMPVTVGVMINPGTVKAAEAGQQDRSNRSFEYDSLGDAYARFLIDEILPEALKGLNVTTDPAGRAICGNSSGGICAFTVAWERPDSFRKVVSHIGSFTNIRGGYVYPALIRKVKKRRNRCAFSCRTGATTWITCSAIGRFPARTWPRRLSLRGMTTSLSLGTGSTPGKHGASIFPETMRWLWRDYAK